jgi:threonine dehydrogenase-like Zn-dependent dehydrogenase
VGVFGAGPIGLPCSAVAQAFGVSKVVNVDIVDSRLAFAQIFGAHLTYKAQNTTQVCWLIKCNCRQGSM